MLARGIIFGNQKFLAAKIGPRDRLWAGPISRDSPPRLHLSFILLFLQVAIQSCNRSGIRQQLTWRTENWGVFVAAKCTSVQWSWICDDVIPSLIPKIPPSYGLVPRPSCFQFLQKKPYLQLEKARCFLPHDMTYSTYDVTGSRHQDIHILYPATEKLEKEDNEATHLILLSFPW